MIFRAAAVLDANAGNEILNGKTLKLRQAVQNFIAVVESRDGNTASDTAEILRKELFMPKHLTSGWLYPKLRLCKATPKSSLY